MSKLETLDGQQTNWCGLWWHPEYNGFSSQAIDLSQLKKFKGAVRLYVRKNKYFNGGENGRPNYTFCLKDAKCDSPFEVMFEMEDENEANSQNLIDELAEVMRDGRNNGDMAMLPSESQVMAREYMQRAIDIIEELTGETWEFSYITF